MRQHTISEWLLRYHAHDRGGPTLWVMDKTSGDVGERPTSTFLAPRNSHSIEIEQALNRIEAPAARAAAEVCRRAEPHLSGFVRIAGPDDPDEEHVAPPREVGVVEGFRLTVVDAQAPRLKDRDRSALGSFVALMYSRSPKLQKATTDMAAAYVDGLREGAARLSGRLPRKLAEELATAEERVRWVGLNEARRIGERLASGSWWLLKTGDGEAFVLGDSAVTTALAIGHNDVWRPLFDPATYAVLLPLTPGLLLLISPRPFIPGAGPVYDPVKTTNMLAWKWAEQLIGGPSAQTLEDLRRHIQEAGWQDDAQVTTNLDDARRVGVHFVAPYVAAMADRRRSSQRPRRR